MKLSTLNSKLKLCSIGTNAKTSKSDSSFEDTLTLIMYLSPHTLGGRGNVCSFATQGCKDVCLYTAGRGSFSTVQKARQRRTQLFFDDIGTFKEFLFSDLSLFLSYCNDNNLKPFARLNGTSDLDFQKIKIKDNLTIFELFPTVTFYDYTKDFKRLPKFDNYSLTYSYHENLTLTQIKTKLSQGINVAVVFEKQLPSFWNSIEVIDGDKSDLRPFDKKQCLVGLVAKGLARKIKTDFVVNPNKILVEEVIHG